MPLSGAGQGFGYAGDSYLLSAGGVALGLTEPGACEIVAEFERSRFSPGLTQPVDVTPFSSTPTLLDSLFNTAPASDVITTASVTLTLGRLYLFGAMLDRGATPDITTSTFAHGATDRTADWHAIPQVTVAAGARVMALFWHIATVTETVAITFDFSGAAANSWAYGLAEVAGGFDTTTPIRQSTTGTATAAGTVTGTMTDPPLPGNMVCSLVGVRGLATQVNPRQNWTELWDVQGSGAGGLGISGDFEFQYARDPYLEQMGDSGSAGSRSWGIIVFEIAAGVTSTAAATTGGLSVDATATHTASSGVTATVAATTAGLTAALTATETIPGTAAATTAGLNGASTVAETFTATAAATTAGLTAAATASERIPGTVAATTAGLNATATATESIPGTAAATTAGLNASATALVANPITATAAGTTAGLNAAATASERIPGTAAATVAGLNAAATASERIPGTVAATTAGLNAAATASERIPGTAALTVAGLSVAASNTGLVSGTVSATTAGLNASSSASERIPGTAAATTAGLNAAATSTVLNPVTATVGATVAGLSCSATVAEAFQATAAATVAGLAASVTAGVPESVTGIATATVAGLSCVVDASAPTPAHITRQVMSGPDLADFVLGGWRRRRRR